LGTTMAQDAALSSMIASGAEHNERIDPRLHEFAQQTPLETVRVIVQKVAGDQAVEQWVEGQGGVVIRDLPIINAFAAEMSAAVVRQLAQNPAVRWISLDAPVSSSLLGLGNKKPANPANYYLDTLGIASLAQQGIDGRG